MGQGGKMNFHEPGKWFLLKRKSTIRHEVSIVLKKNKRNIVSAHL